MMIMMTDYVLVYQEQCTLEKTIVALKADNQHLQEKVDVRCVFYRRTYIVRANSSFSLRNFHCYIFSFMCTIFLVVLDYSFFV